MGVAAQYANLRPWPPELLSVLGSVRLSSDALLNLQRMETTSIRVPSPDSGRGSFRAKLWLQPGRAPLAVILSGLFSDLSEQEGFTAQQLLFFHERGYHVAVLPTIGGRSSLDDHSRVLPFEVHKAGQLELGLLQGLRQQIGTARIERTHLVSVSYGALIAAVMTALDAGAEQPVIDSTTCYSPVYDARDALLAVDEGIRASMAPRYQQCGDFARNLFPYLHLFVEDARGKVPELLLRCEGWLVARMGYQRVLADHLEGLHENRSFYGPALDLLPRPAEQITFHEYASALTRNDPSFSLEPSREFLFTYWAGIAASLSHGRSRIRMVTDADEILGHEFAWTSNAEYDFAPGSNLIVLPWGGHFGYAYYQKWFGELMRSAFPVADGTRP